MTTVDAFCSARAHTVAKTMYCDKHTYHDTKTLRTQSNQSARPSHARSSRGGVTPSPFGRTQRTIRRSDGVSGTIFGNVASQPNYSRGLTRFSSDVLAIESMESQSALAIDARCSTLTTQWTSQHSQHERMGRQNLVCLSCLQLGLEAVQVTLQKGVGSPFMNESRSLGRIPHVCSFYGKKTTQF